MSRNVTPTEGGPSGGQLEAKVGAFYFLSMLCESEPRGLPGCTARLVKFQRGYEGHALDDLVVEGFDAAGGAASLEIQSKRSLDFTASDPQFAKVVAQIVAGSRYGSARPIAVAIGRTSAKIERHYYQLLQLARKMASAEGLRRALDAPRVTSAGMRDFAKAMLTHIGAAGGSATDEALWVTLRRFQILLFDFESPGAISALLVEALSRMVLPSAESGRHLELWEALETKALSYDADGGEITRNELVSWLKHERSLDLAPGRNLRLARQRFGDHSNAALAAIDDRIAGIALDRADRIEAIRREMESSRFVEVVGESGFGKSAMLKALADEGAIEAKPLVLTPSRTPAGGWLTFSTHLGFQGSATEFLTDIAASGSTILFIDSLDRLTDAGVQATVVDLIVAASKVPMMRVVAAVGSDFSIEQRRWLPETAIARLGRSALVIGPLDDDEVAALASEDGRLAQLLHHSEAQPLARNLFQLRQLLTRSGTALPITEAALAKSWWEAGSSLSTIRQRDRLKALRQFARQSATGVTVLDISDIDSSVTEDLVRANELVEIFAGSRAVFRHDVHRDWAIANLLAEESAIVDELPLSRVAIPGLARAVEIYARQLVERDGGQVAWAALLSKVSTPSIHGSWRRAVLLALVRSEQSTLVLDRVLDILQADGGRILQDLIRLTAAADSESVVERFVAAGIDRSLLPESFRVPTGFSWTRLMVWLLARLDQFQVPVGRDLLHFFTSWLLAHAVNDPLKPLIVRKLYDWLVDLEGWDSTDRDSSTVRLFAHNGRYGSSRGLNQEVRALFLMSCDQCPDLAEAYLRQHIGGGDRRDVAGDVLMFTRATAVAAPSALADFTIDALISAEERYVEEYRPRQTERLSYHPELSHSPSPSRGPFLNVLRSSPTDGLREATSYRVQRGLAG
jgi:hypothetical protein